MNLQTGNNLLIKSALAVAAGLAFAWLGSLTMMLLRHLWILDAQGRPLFTDFFEVWVAGRTALHGAAAAAYDPELHHAAQVAAAGHALRGFLWWHYPPLYLLVAAALALLPYAAAFLTWSAITLACFAAMVAAIARSRLAALAACGIPAVFINTFVGQNGCFTAALIGGALLNLETRPMLAGLFLGLLTYKPQMGLLFPLVLAATGRWRALLAAGAATILAIVVPWCIFGGDTFRAFLHFLPRASDSLLTHGAAGWNKQQTIYGLARWLGCDSFPASLLQAAVMLMTAAAVTWMWRRNVTFGLKAATLATGVFVVTPYLYMYDFPMLAVPLAFLFRDRAFDRVEIAGIALANLLILVFASGFLTIPIGPFAVAAVGALIARRAAQQSAAPAQQRTSLAMQVA
ncbi:MAG TPA: glycosyltransferase family 87 protein [Rhizomicrobium sp.]|nr:glycosyltransferase family 87 protein [Rhizomicrobium sp.]